MFRFQNSSVGSKEVRLTLLTQGMETLPGTNVNFSGLSFLQNGYTFATIGGDSIYLTPGDYQIAWCTFSAVPNEVAGLQLTSDNPSIMFEDKGENISQTYLVPNTGAVENFTYVTIPPGTPPVAIHFAITKQKTVVASIWITKK